MTQLIANFFYDNSGSINATFTDTDGATGSISESADYNGINSFYGLTDVEYESVKVYTGSCELQPIVTGSGFVFCNEFDPYNNFSYSQDGSRIGSRYLMLPTTSSKVGSASYAFSGFSTGGYYDVNTQLFRGIYGGGTLVYIPNGSSAECFCISDDLGKTWRYSVFPGRADQLNGIVDPDVQIYTPVHGVYGNGIFVAFGWSGEKCYSTDNGYTWNFTDDFGYDKYSAFSISNGTQIVFDGTRFIQCGVHYEYDRYDEPYRVIMGRYSYDGKKWINFIPQNEFLVEQLTSDGALVKDCNVFPQQLFTISGSTYVLTSKVTSIPNYPYYESEYHIRHVYSSSIANDDTIVPIEVGSAVSGMFSDSIGGGTNDCVYIPQMFTKNISGGIEYYLHRFNPSTNSVSEFKFHTRYYDDPYQYIYVDIVGYNRDNNTFMLCGDSNKDSYSPMFSITDEVDVHVSRIAKFKDQGNYTYINLNVNQVIPIVSSILSGSIPPTSSATPPDNQYFASASLISSLYFTASGSNENAATESIDPPMSASATVWFKWTPTDATGSSVYSISTLGSDFDTVLYLFELSGSESPENLVQLEWNDDYNGFSSTVDAAITGSKTYYICVGGHKGDYGNYVLSSSYINPPPINDTYENAFIMEGNSGVVSGSNRYATTELIEGGTHYHNVWWKWTPTVSKTTTMSISGSSFPAFGDVYTRSDSTFVYEEHFYSSTQFSVVSGSTYYVAISGRESNIGYTGDIRLSYT